MEVQCDLGINGARYRNFDVIRNADIDILLDDADREFPASRQVPITGKVSINIRNNFIEFQSMKIQVEGFSAVHFETSVDKLTDLKAFQYKLHYFLPASGLPKTNLLNPPSNPNPVLDPNSTLCQYMLRPHDPKDKRTLMKGQHVFPFELRWDGETLPGSFKGCQGRVQYKLILYVKPWMAEFSAADKELNCSGYLNLAPGVAPSALYQPFSTTVKKTKSFFSSKTIMRATFIVEKRCFIRGENINFQLTVENLERDEGEAVEKMTVTILQKMSFTDNNFSKGTRSVIKRKEMQCEDHQLKNGDIFWDDAIRVPANARPTFHIDVTPKKNGTVETNYLVLFEVELKGKSSMKGEAPIVIGTCRERPDS